MGAHQAGLVPHVKPVIDPKGGVVGYRVETVSPIEAMTHEELVSHVREQDRLIEMLHTVISENILKFINDMKGG